MSRVYNFSSGPAMLPLSVLEKAKQQLPEYENTGQSVMEMSHRSPEFNTILIDCQNLLREVLNINDDYHILFVQGGASLQFSMIPLNLAVNKVQIINTGEWTRKAFGEHNKLVSTEIIASSEEANFSYIPKITKDMLDPSSDYLYICQNNTVFGTAYHSLPDCGDLPLVSDASSNILSEPLDINKYGLLFAGTQKNIGPAGVCLVIIRKDLVKTKDNLPTMLDYNSYIENNSLYNTPPTYTIYMMGLVLQWIKDEIGGLQNMKTLNTTKADLLYDFLDESTLFFNPVSKEDRSLMNIPFFTNNEKLDALFVAEADKRGLVNLAGHRIAGGMRASVYNAMPIEGVKTLIEFMKNFEVQHG